MIRRFLLTAVLALAPLSAMAQGICPIGQAAPQIITTNSYTLTNENNCNFLIFSSGGPVTVTAPTASGLINPNWQVMLMTTGAPLTVSTSSTVNGSSQGPTVGGYNPMTLQASAGNYFFFTSTPQPQAGQYLNQAATAGLQPGTSKDSSWIYKLGAGIMQFSNEGAWREGAAPVKLSTNMCSGAPFGWGQNGPSWLTVVDAYGLFRYIPTC